MQTIKVQSSLRIYIILASAYVIRSCLPIKDWSDCMDAFDGRTWKRIYFAVFQLILTMNHFWHLYTNRAQIKKWRKISLSVLVILAKSEYIWLYNMQTCKH